MIKLNFFLFLWIKINILKEKRHIKDEPQSIQVVYKREKKESFKQGLINLQNLQRKGDQSKKNPLVHAHKLQRKNDLHPWIECSLFAKALLFLSFQTIQKRHKGAENPTFFNQFFLFVTYYLLHVDFHNSVS